VQNRIGFHGSLSRSREKAGFGIFDIESPRGIEFFRLILDMRELAYRMIKWSTERMSKAVEPNKFLQEFDLELTGYTVSRGELSS
jgi:hypothetical protein